MITDIALVLLFAFAPLAAILILTEIGRVVRNIH